MLRMLAAEVNSALRDFMSELLQTEMPPTHMECDTLAGKRHAERGTDRRTEMAFKKPQAYLESSIARGQMFLDLQPRRWNVADNLAQHGAPIAHWTWRMQNIQGTRPEIHVTPMVRSLCEMAAPSEAAGVLERRQQWSEAVDREFWNSLD